MPIPDLDSEGNLPVGVHQASLEEVLDRFGSGTQQREAVSERLVRARHLASSTGMLARFVVFGSYVTAKHEPNDMDIVLVMQDDFRLSDCPEEALLLFDHERADRELKASVFWIRPAHLLAGSIEEFIEHWQVRRDGGRRGIVEVVP